MQNKKAAQENIPKNEKEIIFMTNLPEEFQVANNTITIESTYDQEALNKILKKLLRYNEKSFNFFISNKILDKPLHNFLLENPDILKESEEKPIEIYYSFQMEEPKLVNTIKEDEWIKKITLRKNANLKHELEYFCVGLFNSECSFYNRNQEKIFKINENESGNEENVCEILHDICFFNNLAGDNILLKASRNENEAVKIYNIDLNKAAYKQIYSVGKTDMEYVNALSVNAVDPKFFCAGDTLGNVKIFKIPEAKAAEDSNQNNKNKKRKIYIEKLHPEVVMEKCHDKREIKLISWLNNQQILTTGDDFNMKIWNIHTKTNYLSMNTNHKYVSSICNFGSDTVISGHDDGRIKFWDLRSGKVSNIFVGHNKLVSAINFDGEDYSKFSSVGLDGNLNIWDVRSNQAAIFSLKTDCEKNFGLSYNTSDYLICGGESAKINFYSAK